MAQPISFVKKGVVRHVLLTLCIASGCGFLHASQEEQEASQVIARHFQELATNGVTSALQDYASGFFRNTTRRKWGETLAELGANGGTFRNYEVMGSSVLRRSGPSGASIKVALECRVNYSRRSDNERFTLFKGQSDSDYQIIDHRIELIAAPQGERRLFFIAAGICGLAFVWALAAAVHPGIRARTRWGKGGAGVISLQGNPTSALGAAAWALNALVWGIVLLALGMRYEPIVGVAGWLVGGALVLLLTARIWDWSNGR